MTDYYDLCRSCARKEYTITDESKHRMSESAKNKPPITQETRDKMSVSGKNKPPVTQKTRDKISKIHKGKPMSEAQKKKISETLKGKPSYVRTEKTKRTSSALQQGITYDEWEKYTRNSPYCPAFNDKCRESNREKYDRRCFICGLPEVDNITSTGKHKRLSVHHVDMNKSAGCDGVRWKLVPVCLNCHGMLHTKIWEARVEYLLADKCRIQ